MNTNQMTLTFPDGTVFTQDKNNLQLLACKCCQTILPASFSDTTTLVCTYCGRDVLDVDKPTIKMNHGVNDYGVWVPYINQWRFKDRYDILLKGGTIILQTYPNAKSFHNMNPQINPNAPISRVEDDDVIMIRLVPDSEIVEKYHFSGEERSNRNDDYFGDAVPHIEDYKVIDGVRCILR